jgi:hypothetical protein
MSDHKPDAADATRAGARPNDPANLRADRNADRSNDRSASENNPSGAGREADPYDRLPAQPPEQYGEVF